MSDEYNLESGFADYGRLSMSIGVGSIIAGKSDRLQKIVRAQALSPFDKFMEGVQYACYTENIPSQTELFEKIATRFPRPQYLNARVCAHVANIVLERAGQIRMKEFTSDVIRDLKNVDINPLDGYRYAKMMLEVLR
jgi:hypothetical protein